MNLCEHFIEQFSRGGGRAGGTPSRNTTSNRGRANESSRGFGGISVGNSIRPSSIMIFL